MKVCHILLKVFWTSIEIIKLFYCSFYLSLHHRDKSHMILLYNSFFFRVIIPSFYLFFKVFYLYFFLFLFLLYFALQDCIGFAIH